MVQRFAASAIAVAIVVARLLAGGAPLPHHSARTALATSMGSARTPARQLRADRSTSAELTQLAHASALLAPSIPQLPPPPPAGAAPPFLDTRTLRPPPSATAARARAPPVVG